MPPSSPADLHRARLDAWLARHPGSPHLRHDLDALAALKSTNDARAARDRRLRPEVCESMPSFVTVGNTHKCNLTCNMCFKQLDLVENMSLPDMGLSRFETLAHELFPHLHTVALSVSGDPLLSRTLFDELDLLATYGVRASVTTNGMPLARKGLFEHLLPALHTLVLSMDGASRPVFDSIRRGASFARVVENIRRFTAARDAFSQEFRPELHFSTILQHKNVHELPALIELAHALGVDRVAVDHVYIHAGLNDADSLDGHKALANEMLERARATAERLGMPVMLPDPFRLEPGHRDAPFEPIGETELLAHAAHVLPTVPFDPTQHERWFEKPDYAVLARLAQRGGGNADLVEALLDQRLLSGHLLWGVPQLGPALIPRANEKVSACAYAWRETFVEWNGVVSPCCNPAMGAGRVMGVLDEGGGSFAEIWNGAAYRNLRKSLATGKNYRFCRYCYLYESPDDAAWGSKETWIKVGADLAGETPALAGSVPAGQRAVLTELRSDSVPAGSRLEIYADERLLLTVAATAQDGNGHFAFTAPLPARPTLSGGQLVHLRCLGAPRAHVDLVAYVE